MQHFNPNQSLQSELSNAIKVSVEHFFSLEKHFGNLMERSFESLHETQNFSKLNYIAILALEKLGLKEPTQEQIDGMERILQKTFNY